MHLLFKPSFDKFENFIIYHMSIKEIVLNMMKLNIITQSFLILNTWLVM